MCRTLGLSLILDTNLTEMMTAASEEAMTTWQSLPDELTVYRGCYKNNKKGLSWTLDKNTALQFPTFNRYKQKGQALLLTGKVKKTDGLLFVDRKESEVLSSRVVVISTEVIRENDKEVNHA